MWEVYSNTCTQDDSYQGVLRPYWTKKKSKTGILPIVIWPEVFAPLKYELPGEVKEWLSVPYNLINTATEAGASHGGPHLQ